MRRLLLLVIIFANCIAVGTTASEKQSSGENDTRLSAARVARGTQLFCRRLLPSLSPSEAKIVRAIIFDDPAVQSRDRLDIPCAYLDKKGRRHVSMSAGFGSLILQLSVAVTLQQADSSCKYSDYVRYAGEVTHRNRDAIRKQSLPESAGSALDFYHVSVEQWEQLMERNNEYYKNTFMGSLDAIQDFVLAHEIGHHVLGHVFHSPKSLEESRKQEKAADEWAIHALVRMGELPAGGVIFAIFMVASRGSDIVFEHLESHPAEFRRFDYIVEALVKNIRVLPESSFPPGYDVQSFENEMQALQIQLHAEFEKSVYEENPDRADTSDPDWYR